MNKKERQKIILHKIHELGIVKTNELSEEYNVSALTIRRDLKSLEKTGSIKCVVNGAVSRFESKEYLPLSLRMDQNNRVKQSVAKYAASLIENDDFIGIDSGSTALEIAKHIPENKTFMILTTNLEVVHLFRKRKDIKILVPGGLINYDEQSIYGDLTVTSLKSFYLNKFFLSFVGIDEDKGITTYYPEISKIKSAMIKNSRINIAVSDSSKFGVVSFSYVCGLNSIQKIITEKKPKESFIRVAHLNNITIDVVNSEGRVEHF